MSCKSPACSVQPSVAGDEEAGEFPSGSTNPCKLCTPLGACLAFKGIAGAVPLLHGSQGCATYIRRYLISHFREPVDVASTNFSEDSAVFGGRKNLHTALDNIARQYRPALVGIATTCLSETMGENMPMLLHEYCGVRSAEFGVAGKAERSAGGETSGEGSEGRAQPPGAPDERTARRSVPTPEDPEPAVLPFRNPQPELRNSEGPALVHVSTPSFKGTHADGFHSAIRALVETLAEDAEGRAGARGAPSDRTARRSVPTSADEPVLLSETQNRKPENGEKSPVAIFANIVSPADLRHLRELCAEWKADVTLVPDYSETLDGPSWADFERTPAGGTTVAELRALGGAAAAVEFGHVLAGAERTAGTHLQTKFHVPLHRIGLPIGLRSTDAFCAALHVACSDVGASSLAMADTKLPANRLLQGKPSFCAVVDSSGRELTLPRRIALERGRLVDSYVDAHKYLAGKKAVVYGEEDLVAGLAVFLAETGIVPVLCASGGRTKRLAEAILTAAPELRGRCEVREGADFGEIETRIVELKPDLLIGSSKGYKLARALGVPLVRCGFPVHDRLGAPRIRLLGYAGTQEFFDRIVNALLEAKQEQSEVGFSYL